MGKRFVAGILWFVTGWYGGAYLALVFGVPEMIGPILGAAAAAFFAGDPLGVIWKRRELPESTTMLRAETPSEDLPRAA